MNLKARILATSDLLSPLLFFSLRDDGFLFLFGSSRVGIRIETQPSRNNRKDCLESMWRREEGIIEPLKPTEHFSIPRFELRLAQHHAEKGLFQERCDFGGIIHAIENQAQHA